MLSMTVDVAQSYMISLKQNKANRVDWLTMTGKNKLRRFFVHAQWQDYIASVDVSSAGVKGGVFFLEAYVVDLVAFKQRLMDRNGLSLGLIDANLVCKKLETDKHLSGQLVHPRVMQLNFQLSNIYAKNVTGRTALLTALRNSVQLRKQYVVKGANEPGRTLFAEYVLSSIGKAKIPKSLVLEIDPNRPHTDADPSEGMIMLNLINTRRKVGVDAARYAAAYANLYDGNQPVVDYLVVQKLLKGDSIIGANELTGQITKFLCDQKIIVHVFSFLSDQNFTGESEDTIDTLVKELTQQGCLISNLVAPNFQAALNNVPTLSNKRTEIAAVLTAVEQMWAANQWQRQDYEGKNPGMKFDQLVQDLAGQNTPLKAALDDFLDEIREIITRHKRILMNGDMMKNTGRVHFADVLVGNADRFGEFNTGNFFYLTRPAKANKVPNPICCIDNDSFLQTYLPGPQIKDYVNDLFDGAVEVWGWNDPQPPALVFAPTARLLSTLEFNTWFQKTFITAFIMGTIPRTVLDMYGPELFAPGDTFPFPNTANLQEWSNVSRNLREGLYSALVDYQKTAIQEFEGVYRRLTAMYYPGPNFEFTAFAIRHRYLVKRIVDPQNWTIQLPNTGQKRLILNEIIDWLIEGGMVNSECNAPQVTPFADAALTYGVQIQYISQAQAQNIRDLLLSMAQADQVHLLPKPFGLEDKHPLAAQWTKLSNQARPRMARVVCALLNQFWNNYITEIGYLTNDRRRVTQSYAFKQAVNLCGNVTKAKLYKDSNKQRELRKQVLSILGLGGDLSLPK